MEAEAVKELVFLVQFVHLLARIVVDAMLQTALVLLLVSSDC